MSENNTESTVILNFLFKFWFHNYLINFEDKQQSDKDYKNYHREAKIDIFLSI